MDCGTLRSQVGAWVDGELGDDAAGALEAHARECASCDGRRRMEAALRDALRADAPRPPEDLERRVRAAVAAVRAPAPAAERPRSVPRAGRWAWAFVLALATIAGLVAFVPALRSGSHGPLGLVPANPVQVRGMLYCPGCMLRERPSGPESVLLPGTDADAPLAHALLHLRTDGGDDWQVVPVSEEARAAAAHDHAPRHAFVVGTAWPDAHVLHAARVTLE